MGGRWEGGGWLMCSLLARLPPLQLEPEADVPSCNLSLPVVTDGENKLPRILSLITQAGLAAGWVHSGGAWT